MRHFTTLRYLTATSVAALALAAPALAQPADRAGAIIQAAGTAQAASPGTWFVSAELQPDGSTWIVDVKTVTTDGSRLTRSRVNAFTMALGRVRTEVVSASSMAQLAALVTAEAAATRTLGEALGLAAGQAGAGASLTGVELEWQNSPPGLFYDVTMNTGGVVGVVRVSASADSPPPSGGAGGGGTPDDHGGGGTGGADDPTGGTGFPNLGPVPSLPEAIVAAALANPGFIVLEAEVAIRQGASIYKLELLAPDGLVQEMKLGADGTVLETGAETLSPEKLAKVAFVQGAIGTATIGLGEAVRIVSTAHPEAQVLSAEWEAEHGRLVAKVQAQIAGALVTTLIDAATGATVGGAQPGPGGSTLLGLTQILTAAGNAVPGLVPVKTELDVEHGVSMFSVLLLNPTDFSAQRAVVNASTGQVLSVTPVTMSRKVSSSLKNKLARLGELQVTFEAAATAALSAGTPAPGAFVRTVEIDVVKRRIGYVVEVAAGKVRTRVFVDGVSGAVSTRR